jgi:hypothetical protein
MAGGTSWGTPGSDDASRDMQQADLALGDLAEESLDAQAVLFKYRHRLRSGQRSRRDNRAGGVIGRQRSLVDALRRQRAQAQQDGSGPGEKDDESFQNVVLLCSKGLHAT